MKSPLVSTNMHLNAFESNCYFDFFHRKKEKNNTQHADPKI